MGPTTASPGGGVATTATAQPISTTAIPSGSGQGASKETFEPLELNYLQLLGQEVMVFCECVVGGVTYHSKALKLHLSRVWG